MEAPNKLFIKPEKIKVEMIPGGELPNVGIQYVRKDLLLEWAKHELDGWNQNLDTANKNGLGEATKATCNGCRLALESFINKLNSL